MTPGLVDIVPWTRQQWLHNELLTVWYTCPVSDQQERSGTVGTVQTDVQLGWYHGSFRGVILQAC